MVRVVLTKKTIKTLGINFTYNEKLENEDNFIRHVRKTEKVLKLWRMRNMKNFKTLAISKTPYTPVPSY